MAFTGLTATDGTPDAAASQGRANVFPGGTQDGAPSPGRASNDPEVQQAGLGVTTTVAMPSTNAAGAALPDPVITPNADASVTKKISGESEADLLDQHLLQPDLPAALEAYMRSLRAPPQWNTWQKAF